MSLAEPETVPVGQLQQVPAGPPALRLLPAPLSEPPYDDERTGSTELRVLVPQPASPTSPVRPAPQAPLAPLRLVPDRAPDDLTDDDAFARTPLNALPAARPFAHALVQRLLEVLAGLRPVGQLQRDTTLEVYDELSATVSARGRSAGPRPTRRDVRSVHVQTRDDGVAEVCATVRRDGRVTALALRLEGRSGSWCCTDLLGV